MIDIIIAILAFFLVLRIARGKGIKGPVPGITAALSFPVGIFFGAVIFTLVSSRPYPYTVRGSYLLLAFQDLAYTIPVLTGLLLLATVILYFLIIPQRTPSKQSRRKTLFPFGFLGVLLVLIGLTILYNFGTSYLWSFIGFGSFLLASKCFALAKRRRALSAERVLGKDKRKPVLFLRSFTGESRLNKIAGNYNSTWRLPWAREKTVEEQFFKPFSRLLGPVIALGNPDDYLPQLGAARTYTADTNWFDVFESFAQKAACVLIRPDVSDGLMRELRYIRQNLHPNRVFLFFDELISASIWSRFITIMNEAGFEILPSRPAEDSIQGFTSEWIYHSVGKNLATPIEYATAISQALNNGQETEFAGSAVMIAERQRQSKAYALGRWMAATVHKVGSVLRLLGRGAGPSKGI